MADEFFQKPILNSPYEYPKRHWELDRDGQPTRRIIDSRRSVSLITPIPKPQKRRRKAEQQELIFDEGKGLSTEEQQYDPTPIINTVRSHLDKWREITDPGLWQVTPETARLLQHWRHHRFSSYRPFFCQIEAIETVIWLTEVAPKHKEGKALLDYLQASNAEANPDLFRLALKMATGSGKTTVMAMIIAWQTINAVRRPSSKRFTRGFLVVTPGITIRDRLRVLQPNDPDAYYASRELVPQDMLPDLDRARIVITNFHAFKLRETMDISKGGRALLQGRDNPPVETTETEGQMMQRVMPELMGMKSILVLNDEAHHCYREKQDEDELKLKGDERKEAERNTEAARLWITGLEAVQKRLGISRVIDLSATPFFLSGSGYAEGTLFPWTMCDFSLMDAIECGIVKLPRVPIADNIPGSEMPKFRNLWTHIRPKMPKKGRGKGKTLDPLSLPVELQTALDALYGHYEKTFNLWQDAKVPVPPCFIIVCNNTSTSKLVYDYVSGFYRVIDSDHKHLVNGRLPLFRNFDDATGEQFGIPNTFLIDSPQLESGDALDSKFRQMAADEIARFRRDILRRTGDRQKAENITDLELLREVMNTVGKEGRLGGSIRCVVSVGMLTEGWDASTVTHVLGVRAFSTQLLCEQVIGRALRRQSYELNEEGLFQVEYADVLGIPFDFTAKPVVAPPQPPQESIHVHAVSPERDHLEITFPRVIGYRIELPEERIAANFTTDCVLELTPNLVGPSVTRNSGIIGEGIDLSLKHTEGVRQQSILFNLTKRLLETKWRDPGDDPKLHLFGQLKSITRQWMDECLVCRGGTYPAQLLYQELADMACERITAAITHTMVDGNEIKAVLDPYNPVGSTQHISFNTSKTPRWKTDPRKCPVNWIVVDSDWELEFCRVAESHPNVRSYIKNQRQLLEVPYRYGSINRTYIPDFLVRVDDDRGEENLLNMVIEIKGYRGEDAKDKKLTMDNYWVPGVNSHGTLGRWTFAELTDVDSMQSDFEELVEKKLEETKGLGASE